MVPTWERTGDCCQALIGLKMKDEHKLSASLVAFISKRVAVEGELASARRDSVQRGSGVEEG